MYVEMVSGGQPFTAGRVCFFHFAPWVLVSDSESRNLKLQVILCWIVDADG